MSAPGKIAVQTCAWDPQLRKLIPINEPVDTDVAGLKQQMPGVRRGNRFLKGPVPWRWITRAASLPGKALEVGLCLWRLKGATGKDSVWLGNAETEPFGIERAAKSRALAALERARLITIDRTDKRRPIITILPYGG